MFLKTDERPQGEPQKVGRLKLSEAIRLGAAMTPQVKRRVKYFDCGGTCAIGAAAVALYGVGVAQSETLDYIEKVLTTYGFRQSQMAIDLFYQLPTREDVADALEAQGY